MAAQALYLKYRPQTFQEVSGQEPITTTLLNALRDGKVRHAYLFTGPRGTGKTTMARLLAKAVNCHAPVGERPCNACPICVAINEGRLLDLIEIDAASNRGIDEIRDIREKVGFRPNEGRFKVYVLDEAHMLTEPAFNALLKTLEEPPPHVIFALVTTDPHKIPATIASRCQRFDFKRIRLQAIVDRLAHIAEQEGVGVEPDALEFIARQGTGAMRDAISLLDQLTSYGDRITLEQVQMVLGTAASESAGRLVACLAEGDVAGGLDLINRTVGDGADPRQFGREVVEYLRGLLLIQEGAGTRLLNATAEQAAEMEALAGRISIARLVRAIRLFNEAATDLRRGLQTIHQLPLEMALVGSTLEPEVSRTVEQPAQEKQTTSVSPGQRTPIQAKPDTRRVAERPAPAPESGVRERTTETARQGDPEPLQPAAEAGAPTGPGDSTPMGVDRAREPRAGEPRVAELPPADSSLTVEQIVGSWTAVLQAVRRKNPTTYGALNTNCEAVEVHDGEITITFPHSFLREKLRDPQRKEEVQEALSEVLRTKCRVKFVLASQYQPQQQANRPAPVAAATEPPAGADAGDGGLDKQEIDKIDQWAKERGGHTKLVES
jgi:DNA polymerase-3 subunit gamma/tau